MRSVRERGAAIAEFALVVPLLMILLVGIIEFGRAYNVQISLNGASREGARALALGKTSSEVDAAVRNASPSTTVHRIVKTACTSAGGPATVRAETDFTFGIPLVPIGQRTLRATSSMRCGL
jgi:Flp pilus assembly protein TadG